MSLDTGRHMIELVNFLEQDPGLMEKFTEFCSKESHSCSESDDCPICSGAITSGN